MIFVGGGGHSRKVYVSPFTGKEYNSLQDIGTEANCLSVKKHYNPETLTNTSHKEYKDCMYFLDKGFMPIQQNYIQDAFVFSGVLVIACILLFIDSLRGN